MKEGSAFLMWIRWYQHPVMLPGHKAWRVEGMHWGHVTGYSWQGLWWGAWPHPVDKEVTERWKQGVNRSALHFIFFFIFFFLSRLHLFYLFFFHAIQSLYYFLCVWWILSYIEMKQPLVYMCSPSRSPLPPPSRKWTVVTVGYGLNEEEITGKGSVCHICEISWANLRVSVEEKETVQETRMSLKAVQKVKSVFWWFIRCR